MGWVLQKAVFLQSRFFKIQKCQYVSYSWKHNSASVHEFISIVFNYTVTQYFPQAPYLLHCIGWMVSWVCGSCLIFLSSSFKCWPLPYLLHTLLKPEISTQSNISPLLYYKWTKMGLSFCPERLVPETCFKGIQEREALVFLCLTTAKGYWGPGSIVCLLLMVTTNHHPVIQNHHQISAANKVSVRYEEIIASSLQRGFPICWY